ncbi:hypothetical protein [Caproicibacter sp. BJN0012]|uniref:hypothetical protein n=1 Tax=Caproicibacter sp. BJN0012 TaxID=3110227 RepID=UPI002E112A04
MLTYKRSFWVCAVLTVLSFIVAILCSHYDFCTASNILIGIFASALLAAVTAGISYRTLRKRTKALMHYKMIQVHHTINQFKLFLQLHTPKAAEQFRELRDVVSQAYSVSFQIGSVFVELSVSDVMLIDKTLCDRINVIKSNVEAFAVDLTKSPMEYQAIIEEQISCIDCKSKEIMQYLEKSNLLGK